VRPTAGKRIGKSLLERRWRCSKRGAFPPGGLFTFRGLRARGRCTEVRLLAADFDGGDVEAVEPPRARQWSCCIGSPASLGACAELTEEIFLGLDVQREILASATRGLRDGSPSRWRICRVSLGKGSEAGSGVTYVKFGAVVRSRSPVLFDRLLAACEALRQKRGCSQLVAGVNTARHAGTAG